MARKTLGDGHDDRLLTVRDRLRGLPGAKGGSQGAGADVGQAVGEIGELPSGHGAGSGPAELLEQRLPEHPAKPLDSLDRVCPVAGADDRRELAGGGGLLATGGCPSTGETVELEVGLEGSEDLGAEKWSLTGKPLEGNISDGLR
jgi:hypothetical protein